MHTRTMHSYGEANGLQGSLSDWMQKLWTKMVLSALLTPFGQFAKDWKWLYVLYMKIYTNQFSYIKNPYLKVKAGNAILKSRADKFLAGLAREYGCYISTGSCRRCKPCRRKLLQPCAHPSSMAYSFEALDINVGELVDLCFQQPLLWYAKGYLPEYTAVVCGLLTQETLPMEFLKTAYLDCIKE